MCRHAMAWLLCAATAAAGLAGRNGQHVEDIMARLAANQDRAEGLRSAFVYDQELRVRFLRGDGRIARDEIRRYRVTPTDKGTAKQLVGFEGRYEKGGALIAYSEPGFKHKDVDIDGELIDELARDLADDARARDGIAANLFPLTTSEQRKYRFILKGSREYRGRNVFEIGFEPKREARDEEEDTPWAGTILVDAEDYQPALVSSRLAKGIPFAVRTMLGTNLKGLGFQLRYERFDEGLWFPVSYGAEFEVKALFFYKRRIAFSMSNRGFQRARVDAKISYEPPR